MCSSFHKNIIKTISSKISKFVLSTSLILSEIQNCSPSGVP